MPLTFLESISCLVAPETYKLAFVPGVAERLTARAPLDFKVEDEKVLIMARNISWISCALMAIAKVALALGSTSLIIFAGLVISAGTFAGSSSVALLLSLVVCERFKANVKATREDPAHTITWPSLASLIT